jgi:hypothetical protein
MFISKSDKSTLEARAEANLFVSAEQEGERRSKSEFRQKHRTNKTEN